MTTYHGLFNQYKQEVAELSELDARVEELGDGLTELKAAADERLTGFAGIKNSLEQSMLKEIEERRKTLTTARRKIKAGDFPAAYELLGDEAGEVRTIEEVTGEEFQGGAKYYANVAGTWLKNVARQASKVVTYPILGNADYKSRVWLQEKMGQEWFDEEIAAGVSIWTNIAAYLAVGITTGYLAGDVLLDPVGSDSPAEAGAAIGGTVALFYAIAECPVRGDPHYQSVPGSLLGSAISSPIRKVGELITKASPEARAKATA